ncbi:MAG: ABC transporter ATP-binding protein, partial [Actinomycetota bacterium]
ILAGLQRELDTTLIVIAYRLSTIRLADRVLYLENGRLRASGLHEELMAAEPGYAAMIHAYERGERASSSEAVGPQRSSRRELPWGKR